MVLKISLQQRQKIANHLQFTYPEEGCGLLLGKIQKNIKQVIEIKETENSWDSPPASSLSEIGNPDQKRSNGSKRNRFSIAPEVLLEVQKDCRDRHLQIVGVYHSHPDGVAIPSDFDRAIAWKEYCYIILAVARGQAKDFRCWTLNDKGQFQAEEIVTTT